MKTTHPKQYQWPYVIGLIFIFCSFIIYLLGSRQTARLSIFSETFFFNYALSIGYLVILFVYKVNKESSRPKIPYACWINLVILLTISAFSLNREMGIFARFPAWLNIYTFLSIPLFLIYPYFNRLPLFLKGTIYILSGASLTLSAYMFIYLLPLLPLSCIALIGLGVSIHSFVPLLWLCVLINFLIGRTESSRSKLLLIPGALIPIFILTVYLIRWQSLQSEIKDLIAEQNIRLDHQLPEDIYLAQKLPQDILSEEILISSFKSQRFWDNGFGFENNSSEKYHDPLSTVALALFGDLSLDRKSVESILNIRKDQRHWTTRKLWTGNSLSTAAVSTNIRMYPEYRVAYQEKIIMVHNDPEKLDRESSWFVTPTQEALYTFHLPEGSIVTSLSLWINGKEQKSRLATLQKADSAYKQIVGVENHDPAIAHWKEGNKVTVNIFPCTAEADRKFKIGFTTPLKLNGNQLMLENIWFEGPDYRNASEVTQILSNSAKIMNKLPEGFEADASGNLLYKGTYIPYWQMVFEKQALSKNRFTFGGFDYALEEAIPVKTKLNIRDVYLDLTSQWTKQEYDDLVTKLATKDLYAWLPEKTKITSINKELVWKGGSKNFFSVPFIFDMNEPEKSLVITKTSHLSPILSDLKQSDISEKFTHYLINSSQKFHVLNIGNELSPFWRSFRELRLIDYEACSTEQAIQETLTGNLKTTVEDSSRTSISESQIVIRKIQNNDTVKQGTAPDHLLRIFAYNDLLRRIGKSYFEKEKYENDMFREAEEAYVVSPVTSMIVLESEADYIRMGIGKNKRTVGNAAIAEGGAVPEPHEWLLIGLIAFVILRYLLKRRTISLS